MFISHNVARWSIEYTNQLDEDFENCFLIIKRKKENYDSYL